ncbi:uncharacterized protein LOC131857683 [Cryptomeria japonica]|uniref:uncharacterized protein LOC131857683 n=1 Tax=Cryptomeria japonica TaxID=3369 RepID=UPI0027D9F42D|nr:uncharacterized protein LOC131857683 [Cryptomeria japonica]
MTISLDMTLFATQEERILQLNALDEIKKSALQHTKSIQNQRMKWNDLYVRDKSFKEGDWALLYDSRYQDNIGKLQTRLLGPYEIVETFPNGVSILSTIDLVRFKLLVNSHQLRLYHKPLRKDDFLWHFSTSSHAEIPAVTDDGLVVTTPS